MPTYLEEDSLFIAPLQRNPPNSGGTCLMVVLVLLIIWVIWVVSKKASFPQYQGASMAGLWEGPMSYGPGHGAISGSNISGGDLMQLERYLHGAPTPM